MLFNLIQVRKLLLLICRAMDCVDELSRGGGVTCKYLTKKKKNNSKHGKQTKATS